jgi:hypothetical protein
MDLVSYWVVGFSGNRHLEKPEAVREELRRALRDLHELAAGQLVAISSAAIGADLLFVEEAKLLGIPWIAVLPFPPDTFFNERDFPDASERDAARQSVAQAADRETVRVPHHPDDAEDSTWRHTAFADAGFRCVDEADVFIAVLHETAEAGKPGGTSQVVAHARARGRPLLIIDPQTHQVRSENWPAALHDPLIDEFRLLRSDPPAAAERAKCPTESAAILAGWRNGFARAARKHVPGIKWGSSAVVVLHALATIITAAIFLLILPLNPGHETGHHALIGVVEKATFVFVLTGFGFLVWVLWKHPQTRAANYRLAAELGRSLLAVWSIPGAALQIMRSPPRNFAHFARSLLLHHRIDPNRRREVPGAILSEKDIQELATRYVANRIEPQIEYYSAKHRQSHRAAKVLEIGSIIFSAVAVLSAGFLAFAGRTELSNLWAFTKLSAATAAPLTLSMLVIHEVKRREARYHEMRHMLAEYAQRIHHARSLSTLRDLVVDAEHLFVSETYEWWILAKENVAA